MGDSPVSQELLEPSSGEVAAVVARKLDRCPDACEVAPDGVDEAAGDRVAVLERDHGRQPLSWSKMTRKLRPLMEPRSACTCSNGRDAGTRAGDAPHRRMLAFVSDMSDSADLAFVTASEWAVVHSYR